VPTSRRSVFPLVPRYRISGLPLGGRASVRRGHGSDVAGSRAYVRGDPISTIDWRASARLSTALDRDAFVVRERYAEEAPRVVVVSDRRPSMGLYQPPFPWLSKPAAVEYATAAIVASAEAVNSTVAYLDHGDDGEPYWLPPTGRGVLEAIESRTRDSDDGAPRDSVARGLDFLGRFRSEFPSGTFVFVISDFLGEPVPDSAWLIAAARRWEAVPVIVQDPVWERSFPAVTSVALPLVDPDTGETVDVRLSRREAAERRTANEQRLAELVGRFHLLGLEPVLIESSDPDEIDHSFLDWSMRRRDSRSRR
jgi:uncharacterized protein (DUF58 family)